MVPQERLNHRGSIEVNTTVVHYSPMSREDPQFKLRMPLELKARIEQAAKESRRSLNAEIVARLEESFSPGRMMIAADEFHRAPSSQVENALEMIDRLREELMSIASKSKE